MFDVPIGEELVVSKPDPKTLALEWSTNDGNPSPSYGNAFAAQEEVDQAMLGYRTAACLFPGCHLPTLYIGMEYMRNHSFKLAEQFFMQAKTICPSDPLVYNELGVVAYHMKDVWIYHEAISCYERALTLLNRSLSTYAGLAYTYHLQDNFSAAITYYHKALWLKPDDQFCTEMLSLALVDEGRHGIDPKIEFE
ncbi:Anaphase-promoting complex subunit 6 [Citrus sinensis]|uniref:Anaphase-promoting complex subunit 6 n=1 Tax=Citrus sinensis TaxID=2711 RepID=A0ACB8M099_CITSI|nr:Anaphase-promoting complex subunit 6 [Citrus sinensis]